MTNKILNNHTLEREKLKSEVVDVRRDLTSTIDDKLKDFVTLM